MLSCSWDSHQRLLIFIQKRCICTQKRPPNKSSGWQAHLQQAPVTTLPLLLGTLAARELWTAKHEEKTEMEAETRPWGGHTLSSFLQFFFYTAPIFHTQENFLGQEKLRQPCTHHTQEHEWEVLKRQPGAVFKAGTFPRGGFEGNFKAHFCEICTWVEVGIEVCSATMTELQLFSPNGFSAKYLTPRQQQGVRVGTSIVWPTAHFHGTAEVTEDQS